MVNSLISQYSMFNIMEYVSRKDIPKDLWGQFTMGTEGVEKHALRQTYDFTHILLH